MRTAVVFVNLGTLERIATDPTFKPVGPLRISALKATLPETVPVNNETDGENIAAVLLAGIVKSVVLEPFESITNGSSPAMALFEVNEMVNEPAMGFGCGLDIDIPTTTC